ncbi:unnamed protein product, partial [Symbiodinium pilosum]
EEIQFVTLRDFLQETERFSSRSILWRRTGKVVGSFQVLRDTEEQKLATNWLYSDDFYFKRLTAESGRPDAKGWKQLGVKDLSLLLGHLSKFGCGVVNVQETTHMEVKCFQTALWRELEAELYPEGKADVGSHDKVLQALFSLVGSAEEG